MLATQDAADALLALSDIWEGAARTPLGRPAVLAVAGLVSAAVSTHKNWTA